jgi:hypothetical protein
MVARRLPLSRHYVQPAKQAPRLFQKISNAPQMFDLSTRCSCRAACNRSTAHTGLPVGESWSTAADVYSARSVNRPSVRIYFDWGVAERGGASVIQQARYERFERKFSAALRIS